MPGFARKLWNRLPVDGAGAMTRLAARRQRLFQKTAARGFWNRMPRGTRLVAMIATRTLWLAALGKTADKALASDKLAAAGRLADLALRVPVTHEVVRRSQIPDTSAPWYRGGPPVIKARHGMASSRHCYPYWKNGA